jgi:hypothetical protein
MKLSQSIKLEDLNAELKKLSDDYSRKILVKRTDIVNNVSKIFTEYFGKKGLAITTSPESISASYKELIIKLTLPVAEEGMSFFKLEVSKPKQIFVITIKKSGSSSNIKIGERIASSEIHDELQIQIDKINSEIAELKDSIGKVDTVSFDFELIDQSKSRSIPVTKGNRIRFGSFKDILEKYFPD